MFGRRKSTSKDKEDKKSSKKQAESTAKHQRTKTAPDPPSLLRLPSSFSSSSRSRRQSNPPPAPQASEQPAKSQQHQRAVSTTSAATVTSPSYFSPNVASSFNEVRSPKRPPASHSVSSHGIDTRTGPPHSLITRGHSDFARRPSHKPTEFAFAQQQLQSSGLISPGSSKSSSRRGDDSLSDERESAAAPQSRKQQTTTAAHTTARHNPTTTTQKPKQPQPEPMASSGDEDSEESSSEYESDSPAEEARPAPPPAQPQPRAKQRTEPEPNEDLFLNIAADSASRQGQAEPASRHDRLRSRIGRINRQSSPLPLQSPPSPVHSSSTTSRLAPAAEPKASTHQRRVSHQPTSSRTIADRGGPLSPHTPIDRPPSRVPDLSSKASFSRVGDAQLSPQDFLAQFNYKQRRPSQPDVQHTPPARAGTYRPSNLGHYSTPRDDPRTVQAEAAQIETSSRADGTESHGSTGPAASVWDELDELKSRIRRIEMGGKLPSTSGQAVSQATAERPRTANTSATTVSSSPNQQRKKSNPSPAESTVTASAYAPSRTHPLLREALSKAKQYTTPAVYRTLEMTATEALTLAEMTGSAGPQGTLHSASSILGGANSTDRQVRRKADNICRGLTELCIALCDTPPALASPALRNSHTISRRPSIQINPDSPLIRQSIEPESNTLSNVSPSRALSRIEARRTSMLNGNYRESSQEQYGDRDVSSRLSRAGTSLHRNRQSVDDDEEEPAFRAPSRAMTDFRAMRNTTERSRLNSRQYTSREPLPDFQQAPTLQSSASLRRPTVSGTANENSLLFRDSRRYDFQRESSPAIEKQNAGTLRARAQLNANRNPNNRNSIGGTLDLGRSVSLGRRARGNSTGE